MGTNGGTGGVLYFNFVMTYLFHNEGITANNTSVMGMHGVDGEPGGIQLSTPFVNVNRGACAHDRLATLQSIALHPSAGQCLPFNITNTDFSALLHPFGNSEPQVETQIG